MTLRDKVVNQILKHAPIPAERQNPKYAFYYKDYADNLYCPMGKSAERAYAGGNGAETKPQTLTRNGASYTLPAKMASIVSSSAMTFNLLGNDCIYMEAGGALPCGIYEIEYEKRMHTLAYGNCPAHLDAFLRNETQKTAIFCEMKTIEWLGEPSKISHSYFMDKYYFKADESTVSVPKDAFEFFARWARVIEKEGFRRYDAWQMFKHLLAIYNYTSFLTKNSVNEFDHNRSMAGMYNDIILANVVNEFPCAWIEDEKIRAEYENALKEERAEAQIFRETMIQCEIPWIFDNNSSAAVRIEYMSAKDFARTLVMSDDKREYLKRYYG